jgi:molybdopterin synthase catalytic subunit
MILLVGYPFPMRVQVLLYGVLKDLFKSQSQMLELPQGSTVESLVRLYRERRPEPAALWPALAIAVNQEYASRSQALKDGDEVALLPPVSGGSGEAEASNTAIDQELRVALVREAIDAQSIVAALKRGEDGAIVVFDGIVRNNTRGRQTLYLIYEAYEEMALRLMRSLATQAVAERGVREVAIVHRLGRLEVGETSVLIAVASAHRGQAFDACRWLIDTLKKTVPIWKKEHFVDGAVWADGDPFPPEIAGKGTLSS